MDNILIPIEQYPDQTMRMDLDGKLTTIRLYWSDFDESLSALVTDDGWIPDGCWNMDISNDEFEAYGIVITGGCDILEPHAQASLGGLFLLSTKPEPEELTFESFGIDHLLLYVSKVNYDEFVTDIGYAR
jgi:hypothetical protein